MSGRDHSYECEACGMWRGGLNDLLCDCDTCEICDERGTPEIPCRCGRRAMTRIALSCLAGNLKTAGALCEAFLLGEERSEPWPDVDGRWHPGCGRQAGSELP